MGLDLQEVVQTWEKGTAFDKGKGVNDGFPYTYYLVTIHSAQSMPRV